jgi:hypothetical protein
MDELKSAKMECPMVVDADWEPYCPEDYEEWAARYSYRVGRRIYRRWDCIVARSLIVSGSLFVWAVVLALLWA